MMQPEMQFTPIEFTSDNKHCSIWNCSLERVDLSRLRECSGLETLSIRVYGLKDIDLGVLSSCRNLRSLSLSNAHVNTLDLAPLSSCSALEAIYLSSNALTAIDLSPLSSLSRLQTVYLGGNRLQSVDLEPLSSCPNLHKIDLGSNNLRTVLLPRSSSLKDLNLICNELEEIDLTPLVDCPSLERLILYYNQFASLDLSPLHKCQRLRRLYLSSRALRHLDVTPLTISGKRPPMLDVGKNVRLMAWAPPGRVFRAAYRRVVIEPPESWAQVRPLVQRGWPYLVQQNVLSALGFSRLGLIDYDLSEQLSSIPADTPLDKAKRGVERVLVEQVVRQIDSGATTIGLRLEDTAGHREIATRVSRVVELRRAEMESLLIPVHQDVVDLRPLWLMAYGFDILLALHANVRTDLAGLKNVRHAVEKAGFELRTTTTRFRLGSTAVSADLGRCILQMALRGQDLVQSP